VDNGDGTFGVGYGGQQYTYNAAQVAAIQLHAANGPVQESRCNRGPSP